MLATVVALANGRGQSRPSGKAALMKRILLVLATMAAAVLLASGMASAIAYGQPDGNLHPYVGTLV